MKHPVTVTCDLCRGAIDTTKPWSTMNVVVPEDVATEVRDEWRRQFGMLSGRLLGIPAIVQTPTHCNVDICSKCEQDRLPDLRALVAVMLLTQLEKARAAAAARPNGADD